MQIQINTGRDVGDNIALTEHVKAVVKKALHHLEPHLTRVEVHLDDENGAKVGVDDKSCTMEARPRHHQPVVVSHRADNMHQAVDGAARKLKSSLEHMFGRLADQHQHQRPDFEDDSPP